MVLLRAQNSAGVGAQLLQWRATSYEGRSVAHRKVGFDTSKYAIKVL